MAQNPLAPTPDPHDSSPAPSALRASFEHALIALDRVGARRLFAEVPHDARARALDRLVVPALERMGRQWEQGTVSLAQVYMAARICEELADGLALPAEAIRVSQPSLAIAVLDDAHALGKRIVLSVLRGAGYVVQDYGSMAEPVALAERAIEARVDVLLVSTLMLRAALRVEDVVTTLRRGGAPTRVIVGGAPFRFDRSLWQSVGADGMGASASEALRFVLRPESGSGGHA